MKTNILFKRFIKNNLSKKKELYCLHNGDKYWRLNDKRHREDGPAVEMKNGYKEWWLYGEKFSEKDYWKAFGI